MKGGYEAEQTKLLASSEQNLDKWRGYHFHAVVKGGLYGDELTNEAAVI